MQREREKEREENIGLFCPMNGVPLSTTSEEAEESGRINGVFRGYF
jgi:hypothetical protein